MVEKEWVIVVDEMDREVEFVEKIFAHVQGYLHRAVSIFLFNDQGQMLLQQRAFSKYHSKGLWTNSCCGHPRPKESIVAAAQRRLFEEMGIRCELEKKFDFIYKADLEENLTEHELDHVFVGYFNGDPKANPDEVFDWKWACPKALIQDVAQNPRCYTAWFKIIFERVISICRPNRALCEGWSSNRADSDSQA